jgi:hypothetical protein
MSLFSWQPEMILFANGLLVIFCVLPCVSVAEMILNFSLNLSAFIWVYLWLRFSFYVPR